jgi:hypothetical protein
MMGKKKDDIELMVLMGMVIFFMIAGVLVVRNAKAITEGECYTKVDSKEFTAPTTVLRTQRRRARHCKTFACFYNAAPRNKKRLTIFVSRKLPSQVLFGTLGWAKSVAVVRNYRKDRLNAVLISAGVEESRLRLESEDGFELHELIEGDLTNHNEVSWENKCLRRAGIPVRPFLELVKIPRL